MVKRKRKRKCLFCRDIFLPKPNNAWHQEYCKKIKCRKASKAASQRRWLNKEENKSYFRNEDNVKRVQQWRKSHPGYWKRKRSCDKNALQDLANAQDEEKQKDTSPLASNALQDLVSAQPAVLIGLIAQITGSTLQDHIAITTSRLGKLGNDIINFKGE